MEYSLFYATGWLGEDASEKPTWTRGRRATHVTIFVAVAVINSLLKNAFIPTVDKVYGASCELTMQIDTAWTTGSPAWYP